MSSEWKQDTFNCCGDCEVCMCGTFCFLCQIHQNAEALGQPGILCCLAAWVLPCVPLMLLRQEAREKYNIEGSTGDDAMCAFCCGPCVSCQTAVEIKERGDGN